MNRFSSCIIKLTETKLKSQLGFKGHLISKFQNPDSIPELVMPTSPEKLAENIHIMLINSSSTTTAQALLHLTSVLKVRRKVIFEWLNFETQYIKTLL
jgi:hypothetical protein